MTDLSAVQRTAWLLRTLDEARVTYTDTAGTGGPLLMPTDWADFYQPLEQLLPVMMAERRSQHWHVSERFRRGTRRTIETPVLKVTKKRALIGPSLEEPAWPVELRRPPHTEFVAGYEVTSSGAARLTVYQWSEKVDNRKVAKGVAWLAGKLERTDLPDWLYRRVLGLPARDETMMPMGRRVA